MLYCTQWLIQCSISVIHHDTVSLWTSVIAGVKKKTRKHKRLLDQSIAGRAPCEATIAVIERHNSSTNWKPTATSTCWWIRGNYPMEQCNFLRQFSLFAKLRLSLHFRSAGILRLFFFGLGELLQRKHWKWQIFALAVCPGSQDASWSTFVWNSKRKANWRIWLHPPGFFYSFTWATLIWSINNF